MPAVRCRYAGLAAAQSPKAPSTCTHVGCACAISMHSSSGSHAPECRLPAWSSTIVGWSGASASARRSASGTMRPCSSASTSSAAGRPRKRSARSADVCRSCPASTRSGGEPASPRESSQPAFISNVSRPAASPVKFAIVAPVTKPTPLSAGSPSSSRNQAAATSSTATTAGVTFRSTVFWSQALTSQSDASAAGCEPPMTKPKKRPDGIAGEAGFARGGEQVDHVLGGSRSVGELTAQRSGDGIGVRLRATPAGRPGWPASGGRARARGRAPGRGRGQVRWLESSCVESLPLAFPAPSPDRPRSSLSA